MGRVVLCARCASPVSMTKLSDWEIRELRRKASAILSEWPAVRGHGERQRRLGYLGREYGVSLRTVYRYLERAA